MNHSESVWLDCDPGHDDAFAILLASYSSNINLIGISTVAGNQSIEKTTKNALNVLNLIGCATENGLTYPLLQGCSKPLLRFGVICDEIHGDSGLECHSSRKFPHIPKNSVDHLSELNQKDTSVHFTTRLYDYLKSSPILVTLIATGPLTNIALLLINYPDVVKYIKKLILMGGACGIGNTGPVAEFNIQVDPEAAHIVFESTLIIYMVPLEITHTALVTHQVLDSIKSLSTNFSAILIDLLLFFKTTYKDVFRMNDPPLHDPCAVAFMIDPSIFEYRLMRVDVEMASAHSYGQTICDIYNMSKKKKNVHVCLKMNVDKFWEMMIAAIKLADAKSPVNNQSTN